MWRGLQASHRTSTLDTAEMLKARWFQPQDLPPLVPAASCVLATWQRARGQRGSGAHEASSLAEALSSERSAPRNRGIK
jgi:hypothetical protein